MENLIAIQQLKNHKFLIPSYQRGYRWSDEVVILLNDILDFINGQSQSFYCLQGVVVRETGGGLFNIIDGQQRLTTIFLIIKFLSKQNFFTISYQTRKNSTTFLKNIATQTESSNIDFYYFIEAYKNIEAFFNNKINKELFLKTLLEQCKILWYEIKDNDENEAFIRLNIGRIPLLEAENIKALFLSSNDSIDSDELKNRAEFW